MICLYPDREDSITQTWKLSHFLMESISHHPYSWSLLSFFALSCFFVFRLYCKGRLHPSLAKPLCVFLHYIKLPFALALFEFGLKKQATPLWTQVDEFVWLGGYHGWHLGRFEKLGIQGVVNLCYETSGPCSWYESHGVTHLHLPTIDHFEPTLQDTEKAVEFIRECVQKKQKVYVHCFGGRGRSAAVTICYLIKAYNWDAATAQDELLKRRPLVRRKLYLQRTVQAFYLKHVSSSVNSASVSTIEVID